MPTIQQLPGASVVDAADELPLSQGGVVRSVTVGTLLGSTQPAILAASGHLLGRVSLGPGGPEEITIGSGLALNAATLQATSIDFGTLATASSLNITGNIIVTSPGAGMQLLPVAAMRGLFAAGTNVSINGGGTISASGATGTGAPYLIGALPTASAAASQDLIGISQQGTDHAISYGSLINGQTIDSAQPASAAADSDTFWVAQGSNTMGRQTLSALWPWVVAKLPSVKAPVVEVSSNTTLDGTTHNGRVLICTQPLTLTPIAANMGSGFVCDIVNASSGTIAFAGSVVTSSGQVGLAPWQSATLRCIAYSGGTLIHAFVGNAAGGGSTTATITLPGGVSGVVATAVSSSAVQVSWAAPATGGAAASYTVQYRATGGTAWTGSVPGVAGTSQTVTGLTASTSYDFSVFALNGAGAGPVSSAVSVSTGAPAGAVSSIVWNVAPVGPYSHGAGVIGVNVHVTPASGAVQFGFSTSPSAPPSVWTSGVNVNTDLWGAYVAVPATAGTWYAWAEGTDGSAPTRYSTPFTVS